MRSETPEKVLSVVKGVKFSKLNGITCQSLKQKGVCEGHKEVPTNAYLGGLCVLFAL